MSKVTRQGHFLGAKLRGQRKKNGLTLEELSMRCAQIDPGRAPSVSYLSMIENGKRLPSEPVLQLLGEVFQRPLEWFLDENPEVEPAPGHARGGVSGVPLEPGFLFSRDLLQNALPELLSQSGTSGRQFAHLLIRTHQEQHRNEFPDLERSAEEIGKRRMPLSVDDLLTEFRRHGLEIRWFDRPPLTANRDGRTVRSMVRSFYEGPNQVFINRLLQQDSARLKYELANHLAHKVLHAGDGQKSVHATSGFMRPNRGEAAGMQPRDVLHAWRDFECSFFAGALLCPKLPFRSFLLREAYRVRACEKLGVTPAVMMRRMTTVSPYRHWHYFDAYRPGFLRAVYRGNGIPLPWGNISLVTDPCPAWAVFDLLERPGVTRPQSQISVMPDHGGNKLYCCHSLRTRDAADNAHVLSVGIDLAPALAAQGVDTTEFIDEIAQGALGRDGELRLNETQQSSLRTVARVLNIHWAEDALELPATTICPRSSECPRSVPCASVRRVTREPALRRVRQEIVREVALKQ